MPEETLPLEEEKELLRWTSIERPFKTRTREFYSTVIVLAILVGVIFFFIEGLMPVLVVAAIMFVVFALSKTPPREVEHAITDKGVISGGDKYVWDELLMFWVDSKPGSEVVQLLTTRQWPRQVIMVLPQNNEAVTVDKVKQTLLKYIPMDRLPPSWVDRAVNWLGEKIPLEE